MKVSELDGAELDYLVAKALGSDGKIEHWGALGDICVSSYEAFEPVPFRPSTLWGNGGPIIERFDVTLESHWLETPLEKAWQARTPSYLYPEWAVGQGKTPLIAAMRAFVVSRYGREV